MLGVAREGDLAVVQLFPLRGGRLGERGGFFLALENTLGAGRSTTSSRRSSHERYESKRGHWVPPR